MSTTKTLTVIQLLVLNTAAQRADHMVMPLPPTIHARGGAQRNLLAALLKMQLVEEVPVDDAAIAGRLMRLAGPWAFVSRQPVSP